MNNINRHALSQMNHDQQIVYTAMMMNPEQIPLFNQSANAEYIRIGNIIKEMFKNGIYKKMTLGNEGVVILE
uniref:Uncharacterized protein n=1 Tax=Pyramimonas orientalis virus TaxID=455367 RepID=A0A7M3UNQ2_POV01|nr:hypothetical protein HWQ62_00190 [Pyramimonas orientalis virus]